MSGAILLDYNNIQDGEISEAGEEESLSRRVQGADDEAVALEVNRALVKTHSDGSRRNSSAVLKHELRDELKEYLNSKLQELLDA